MQHLHAFLVFLFLVYSCNLPKPRWVSTSVLHVEARGPLWGASWFDRRHRHSSKAKGKWSSMFTVDPSRILSSILKSGEIFIPQSSLKDIQILRQCLDCERAEMNLVERTLILYNFTIGLAGETPALQVGRTSVYWDSYNQPTLTVKVDDILLTVEFHNLLLTKSNWHVLQSRGFPPEIAVSSSDFPSTEMVRLGSLEMSGTARIHILSKPLKRDLGVMDLSMDSFDDFTAQMKQATERNFRETGRRGITSLELSQMLQAYFFSKIRDYVLEMLQSSDTTLALENARGLAHEAVGSVMSYASDASRKKGQDLKETLSSRVGMTPGVLAEIRDSLRRMQHDSAVESLHRHEVAQHDGTNLDNGHKSE